MTLAQAKAVAGAAIDNGFNAQLTKVSDNNWTVDVVARTLTIDVQAAASLAASQGVVGNISRIQYT